MTSTTFRGAFTKGVVHINVASTIPFETEGRATVAGNTVALLASSDSGFLTSVNLDIHGGLFYS